MLPTPFRIGDLGAAVIGAGAVQAARLLEQRAGLVQTVHVDVDAAAVTLRASRYLTAVPPVPPFGWRLVGFYPTADGRWVFLQRLFPHHFQRQLAVLGLGRRRQRRGDDRGDRRAGTARCWKTRSSPAGKAVRHGARPDDEWAAHGQGRALAGLPLFSATKTGDSAPEPAGSGDTRPLVHCGSSTSPGSSPGRSARAPSPSTARG